MERAGRCGGGRASHKRIDPKARSEEEEGRGYTASRPLAVPAGACSVTSLWAIFLDGGSAWSHHAHRSLQCWTSAAE